MCIRYVSSAWCSQYSDSLRAGRSGDRIPVGARFSSLVQICPGAHPASCTMGSGSLTGVKRSERRVYHPPPPSAEVKERVELYLYSPSEPSWPVIGWTVPLPFIFTNLHRTLWRLRGERVDSRRKCRERERCEPLLYWGAEEHHLLESSQASPARPSGSSGMKMKMWEKDVTILTVVA